MFYDKAKIDVKAGKGGDGSASFRRERYIAFGGPDGGDGGRGGSVILRANPQLNTLLDYHYRQHFKAPNGGNGRGKKMHGANGADLTLDVPPGTLVTVVDRDILDPTVLTEESFDLMEPGQELVVARGGRGGLGNVHFATSVHQAPRIAENGEPGEERSVLLELKLIADVGLIGYPNAGKSTLLSTVSAAKPKIADYPFTTLEPQLGVVDLDGQTFVVADIPGLIEGASEGAGLGLEFLRHVERCRLLVHVIDGASGLFPGMTEADVAALGGEPSARSPRTDFARINHELEAYSPVLATRPQIVAVNKMDLPEARKRWPKLRTWFTTHGYQVVSISAATGEGVDELVRRMASTLAELPPREALAAVPPAPLAAGEEALHTLRAAPDANAFTITKVDDGFYRVQGPHIERVVSMTRLENEEALDRLQTVLERSGISKALRAAGVATGDTVLIGRTELEWNDEPWATPEGRRAAGRGSRHSGPGKRHS